MVILATIKAPMIHKAYRRDSSKFTRRITIPSRRFLPSCRASRRAIDFRQQPAFEKSLLEGCEELH